MRSRAHLGQRKERELAGERRLEARRLSEACPPNGRARTRCQKVLVAVSGEGKLDLDSRGRDRAKAVHLFVGEPQLLVGPDDNLNRRAVEWIGGEREGRELTLGRYAIDGGVLVGEPHASIRMSNDVERQQLGHGVFGEVAGLDADYDGIDADEGGPPPTPASAR